MNKSAKALALVGLAAALLAACSSGNENESTTTPTSVTAPSPSESTCDDTCLETFTPPPPSPSQTAVGYGDEKATVDFVDSNRIAIENMIAQAVAVRKDAKDGTLENDCTDLSIAVTELQTVLPTGNPDPLVEALTEAASNYENATNACGYERQADFIVTTIKAGDAAVKRAESRAAELGVQL